MDMDFDINELDFENAGSWPLPVKLIALALLAAAVGYAAFYFDISELQNNLQRVEKEEHELRKTFEFKQAKVINLDAYKVQLEEMRVSFGSMLRQLPNQTEVAQLLEDVSQTGLSSGLEFRLFQPQSEQPKDFYAELPIKLQVIGGYHEFGRFVSELAVLPRIVTIHNIQIRGLDTGNDQNKSGKPVLTMDATAKTYRYLEEQEEE